MKTPSFFKLKKGLKAWTEQYKSKTTTDGPDPGVFTDGAC
jgi:hypothetical protein